MVDTNNVFQMMESDDWKGYRNAHSAVDPGRLANIDRTVALIENRDGLPSHRWQYELQEAMTTSSFPNAFGDAVARDLLSLYKATDPGLRQILRQRTVTDFKDIKTFRKGGLQTMRMQQVAEKANYTAAEIELDQTSYALAKYGRQLDFSWEAFLNDDIGIFSDISGDLVHAAMNTENYHITSLFYAAAGPIAASFGNAAAATTPLTATNLSAALAAMRAYRHPDTNEPIFNRGMYLEVGPALRDTAELITQSPMVQWLADDDDVTPPGTYGTTNPLYNRKLRTIVNDWMPYVNTTSGATAWAVYADPTMMPAGEFSRLRGHEAPEIWLKAPDAIKLGGGAVSAFDGDFASDNIFYRCRHTMAGVAVEPRGAWASTGVG